nr:hypothetical protein DA06_12310 [Georgenia sp. SUBG003]
MDRSAVVEGHLVRSDPQTQDLLVVGDDVDPDRLEVLPRAAEQAAAGERRPGVVVVPLELGHHCGAHVHEVTATSHSASRPGVSAAILIPQSARRRATSRS